MKGMREIRNRIKAVKGTGQITHAMELVAASKMKRSQNAAESGRAFAALLMDLTELVATKAVDMGVGRSLPETGKRMIIVFSTEKGLCGALNTNLFKAISEIKDDAVYIAVGSRAARFIARTGRNLLAQFKMSDHVSFKETRAIAEFAMKTAGKGGICTIEVLYTMYINTLKQEPTLVKIAPLDNLDWYIATMRKAYKLDTETRPADNRPIQFEPSPEEVMAELPAFYIKQAMYHMALDAKASEQSARMVAMKAASENADALVDSLTLEYNKARQDQITTEILELAAGAQQEDDM